MTRKRCTTRAACPTARAAAACRGVKLPALSGVALALAVSALADGPWQDPASIAATATAFARQQVDAGTANVQIEARRVDPRLRLRLCDTALEAFRSSQAPLRGNAVVGVRCPGSTPWKVFVPLKVRRLAPVAVVRGPLPAGHRLSAADIDWREHDLNAHAADFVAGRASPVGQVLRQPVRDGQPLRATMLRAAKAIRRGDRVTLAVANPAMTIRMRGIALGDAALGQRVRAKNASSGRVVEGVVREPGLVEVLVY